jgi:hypothetical protein
VRPAGDFIQKIGSLKNFPIMWDNNEACSTAVSRRRAKIMRGHKNIPS